MTKLPISVHILTWNSGRTLERALRSVQECAEVLVIDGGSTDETLAIAEKFGARVVPQRFPGAQGQPLMNFSAARNVGLEHAVEPWILALDSDEMMATEAIDEIRTIVSTFSEQVVYWVPRHYVLEDGTVVARASTYPNERLYFFHRDAVDGWMKPVHERVIVKPGVPKKHLQHGSLAPLAPIGVFKSKLNQYLRIEREEAKGKGWKAWFLRVLHTFRSRAIASLRLIWIWCTPGRGKRLPMEYEMARFWYAWKLVVLTCPIW